MVISRSLRRAWTRAFALSSMLVFSALCAGAWVLRSDRLRARQAVAEGLTGASQEASPRDERAGLGLPSSAVTPEEVRRVVHSAARAETGDTADLRRAALESSDPLVAGNALRAMGRIGALARDQEVVGLLGDQRPRVRQEIILALGSSGDPAAVHDLLPFLEDEDSNLRALAIRSIGMLGGPEAREALERACEGRERTDVERAFLAEALERVR